MPRKQNFTYGIGKRRTAAARVRLFKGKGESLVNDVPIDEYFPTEVEKAIWMRPFEVSGAVDKYHITAKIEGGGKRGQLDALVHGVARVLLATDPEKFKAGLKKARLLTRDARVRERRKVGMGGKSRRQKQSPKR